MKVRIPTPLRSYTNQAPVVVVDDGVNTVGAVFDALDGMYPGIRFRVVDEQNRVRRHMKVFVNDDAVRDLATRLTPGDEVTIMQALSGG